MVTGAEAVTVLVLTVKVELLAPAATVTLAGTVAQRCCRSKERRLHRRWSWPAESHRAG